MSYRQSLLQLKYAKSESVSESSLHAQCYIFFHNTYPKLRGLLSYNLNNSRNKIDGNKNLAMGLQKGRADFELLCNGTVVFIEMKTDSGVQSPDQIKWQKIVESRGYLYLICRSLDEFKGIVRRLIA